MTDIRSLHTIFSALCLLIALFYLIRLVCGHRWPGHFDAENEMGHGIMAIGMLFMLAPAGWVSPELLRWNIILFAIASLWWTFRLLVRKPLLALFLEKNSTSTAIPFEARSDSIHVFMHAGMCSMFLLMSSMVSGTTQSALYVAGLFFVSFAFLAFFYTRETFKNLQVARGNWPQVGTNLAHVLMSVMMSWMFLEMMTMNMRTP